MDTNIGILQYIKSGNISVSNEISKIKAGYDINIRIKQYFMNSPDYQNLNKEVERKQQQLTAEQDMSKRLHLSEELNNLIRLEKQFKINTLHLADTFSRLEINTERLEKARALFDMGRIKEADAVLAEPDLSEDLFNLLVLADYLEQRIGLN